MPKSNSPSSEGSIIGSNEDPFPIIVHCHLRWDGVWQRPQQFLSRLAKKHPVLFCEGPTLVDENIAPRFEIKEAPNAENVLVMQSFFPASKFSDGAWVDSERLRLLKEALAGQLNNQFSDPVQWFYDPMAVTAFAGNIGERAIVYDCMDQLSQFKFAPPELIEREVKLLEKADVVFCGGRKLCESKSRINTNCYFYGCGVDVEHFGKARMAETPLPSDIQSMTKPVLGYFGVVDERLDYELIARLADANPNWSVAIIGPVVKVDPASLPVRPNLYWLGRREYQELPGYTKGFDVCLMPFALNEATEYINPTKACEYMATATPIVSTAVPDVVSNFSDVVDVAQSPQEFIEMCKGAVDQPSQKQIEAGLQMADRNTWDYVVGRLEGHIMDALTGRVTKKSRQTALAV